MMKPAQRWTAAAAVLVFAGAASANAGSGMALAIMAHLVIGNLLIGIAEGITAAAILRVSVILPTVTLIAGNYISAWIGAFTVPSIYVELQALTRWPIDGWAFAMPLTILAAFVLSVVIEAPFLLLFTRGTRRPVLRALLVCAAVNVPTNALMWMYYSSVTEQTLLTTTSRSSIESVLAASPPFDLYFEPHAGSGISKVTWDNASLGDPAPVPLLIADPDTARGFVPHPLMDTVADDPPHQFEALATRDSIFEFETVLLAEARGWGPTFRRLRWHDDDEPRTEFVGLWLQAFVWDYRSVADHTWRPFSIGGMSEWIEIRTGSDSQPHRLRFDSAAGPWLFNRILVLPGDVLIVEVGTQILTIHVPTMRLAPLARGTNPVILLRDSPPGAPGPTPASPSDPAPGVSGPPHPRSPSP